MSSGPLVGWWEVLYHRISSNIWYIRLMTSGWVYGCMPSWTLYSWLIESPNNCGLPSSSCAFQEPILCFRHQYLEMVGSPPCEARPLQPPDRKKRLIYLELAQLLLRKYPSQSTQRSVQFLLLLCRNTGQQPLPRLPWLERAARGDVEINVDLPSLARLAPVMRFNARHRWKQLNNHTFWGSGICENNCYDLSRSLWTWCGIWAAPSILSECSFLAGRYSAHCPRWHELSKRKWKAWVLSPGNWCKYTSMVKQQTVIKLLQYHLCLPSRFRDFLPIWAVSPGKGMEDVRRRRRRCDMLCTLAHLFGPVR